MGSSSSKLRKHLYYGDEAAAVALFATYPELRKITDPNLSYGETYMNNTPLHLAAKHSMRHILKIFLNELGGDPTKTNSNCENALHLACQSKNVHSVECVKLLVNWSPPQGSVPQDKKLDLSTVDKKGNAALHYAAERGYQHCVEFLIEKDLSVLYLPNTEGQTACDLAESKNFVDIAQFLESKMVFRLINGEISTRLEDKKHDYYGLKTQDILEAKDQLLVETSDMLHVPLYVSEALLREHEWSRETLLNAWMKDPVDCCLKSRVQPPTSALQCNVSSGQVQQEYNNESLNSPVHRRLFLDSECGICTDLISASQEPISVPCDHLFCKACWEHYLTIKIQAGESHSILCPAYECLHIVPVDVIERIVCPDMVRRYLKFDIEAFVEGNRYIKWCPHPGCGRAVKFPPGGLQNSPAVECGNGHYFCWSCLGEAHAPCECDKWVEWIGKVASVKLEELTDTFAKTDEAANSLWLVANSKRCPNCQSPIQKNEGCNHMKCYKCKHEFCWACLEQWKIHNNTTGGYFRCNIHESIAKEESAAAKRVTEAEIKNKEMQELKRFVSYFQQFRLHETKFKTELKFIKTLELKKKTKYFIHYLELLPSPKDGFLDQAVEELIMARRVLCGSYVYGYFLADNGYNKNIFEGLQKELEKSTEELSKMLQGSYLKVHYVNIIEQSQKSFNKCQEFLNAVYRGLLPPETPPNQRKRRYPGLPYLDPPTDENFKQVLLASMDSLDSSNPWIKDQHGRHANASAFLDWPSDSDEEVDDVAAAGICNGSSCLRARRRNPRTGQYHNYCSLKCKNTIDDQNQEFLFDNDYSMDLLLALEMSKLSLIQDNIKNTQNTTGSSPASDSGLVASPSGGSEEALDFNTFPY